MADRYCRHCEMLLDEGSPFCDCGLQQCVRCNYSHPAGSPCVKGIDSSTNQYWRQDHDDLTIAMQIACATALGVDENIIQGRYCDHCGYRHPNGAPCVKLKSSSIMISGREIFFGKMYGMSKERILNLLDAKIKMLKESMVEELNKRSEYIATEEKKYPNLSDALKPNYGYDIIDTNPSNQSLPQESDRRGYKSMDDFHDPRSKSEPVNDPVPCNNPEVDKSHGREFYPQPGDKVILDRRFVRAVRNKESNEDIEVLDIVEK